jgi:DNA-binding LytR/AlgR family response regulator
MNALLAELKNRPTAIIAEDEPHLARALKDELARIWPALQVVAVVGDGLSAVRQALALKPDILFFDIQMPGMSGLDAAAELADAWVGNVFPSLVFVTAYDQYALQAFDAHAVDYLLKPVQPQRLQQTIVKLRIAGLNRMHDAIHNVANFNETMSQLRHLIRYDNASVGVMPTLKVFKVSVPNLVGAIKMIPIDDVLYFVACDKYVQVIAKDGDTLKDYLIRTPLKELLPQLDPKLFWQIHRGTVVRASAIDMVTRDDAGKLSLTLHGRPNKFAVSRLYAHLFKSK